MGSANSKMGELFQALTSAEHPHLHNQKATREITIEGVEEDGTRTRTTTIRKA